MNVAAAAGGAYLLVRGINRVMGAMMRGYAAALAWTLSYRWLVLLVGGAAVRFHTV